jgi:hypothetical protein
MNIKFSSIVLFFFFSFMVKGKANTETITPDSLHQLFVTLGQKKIQAQMAQNQKFTELGNFDSLNYIINIDSKSLFIEAGLSAEFISEYIPNNLLEDNKVESIISDNIKLKGYNDQLVEINKLRTIKTYMLFVNYMELNVTDVYDAQDITNAFYNVGDVKKREADAVAKAKTASANLMTELSSQSAFSSSTTPALYYGIIKYLAGYNKKNEYIIRSYAPRTNAYVPNSDGYKRLLSQTISDENWSLYAPKSDGKPITTVDDDRVALDKHIEVIKRTNDLYDQMGNIPNQMMAITISDTMVKRLKALEPRALSMLTYDQRLHGIKVLAGEIINEEKEIVINDLIASMPPNQADFDKFLAALVLKNDKAPAKTAIGSVGGTPRDNPKYKDTLNLMTCLFGDFDDAAIPFQVNSYQRLIINLMKIYKGSSTFQTKVSEYIALTPQKMAERKVIWDKSYFLSLEGFNKPAGTNVNRVTYDNTNSQMTFGNSYLEWTCTEEQTFLNGEPITYQSCKEIWKPSASNVPLNPYDIVTFTNRSDLTLVQGAIPTKCYDPSGKIVFCQTSVPAFFLKYAADKQWNSDAFRAVETGLDALILVTPVGDLAWFGKEINAMYRVAEYSGKYGSLVNTLEKNVGIIDTSTVLGKILRNTADKASLINLINLPMAIVDGRLTKLYSTTKVTEAVTEGFLTNSYKIEEDINTLKNTGKITAEEQNAFIKGRGLVEQMHKDAGRGKYIDELKLKIKAALQKTSLFKPTKLAELFYNRFRALVKLDGSVIRFGAIGNEFAHIEKIANESVLFIDKTVDLTNDYKKVVEVFEDVSYLERTGTNVVRITEDLVVVEKADGSFACIKGACFTAGTLVHTTEGVKPIEQIQANDQVKSFDEVTQTNTWQKVKRTFQKTTQKLVRVIAGKDTIFATPEHPFYVKEDNADGSKIGGWISAGSLKKGLKIALVSGLLANVESAFAFDTATTVYNFEVEKTHTYYVGTEGILVHNSCQVEALNKLYPNVEKAIFDDFKTAINAVSESTVPTALRVPFYKELAKLDDAALKSFIQDFKAGDLAFRANLIKNAGYLELIVDGKAIGKFFKGRSLEILNARTLHGGNTIALSSNKTTTLTGILEDVNVVAERGVNVNLTFNGITKMGENVGGINILRSPKWLEIRAKYKSILDSGDKLSYWQKVTDEFWETANKLWLDEAIARNDNFRFVSNPNSEKAIYVTEKGNFVLDGSGNKIKSIFGREVDYLKSKGYTILDNGTAIK